MRLIKFFLILFILCFFVWIFFSSSTDEKNKEHTESQPQPIPNSKPPDSPPVVSPLTPDEILQKADLMGGIDFEKWCAELLHTQGFSDVELTKASGDQGVDIIAVKDEIRYAFQCKCYSSDIGNHPIQEVHAGKSMYNCHVGVVITNRYFTTGAKDLARATSTLLWDRDKVKLMIQKAQQTEKSDKVLLAQK